MFRVDSFSFVRSAFERSHWFVFGPISICGTKVQSAQDLFSDHWIWINSNVQRVIYWPQAHQIEYIETAENNWKPESSEWQQIKEGEKSCSSLCNRDKSLTNREFRWPFSHLLARKCPTLSIAFVLSFQQRNRSSNFFLLLSLPFVDSCIRRVDHFITQMGLLMWPLAFESALAFISRSVSALRFALPWNTADQLSVRIRFLNNFASRDTGLRRWSERSPPPHSRNGSESSFGRWNNASSSSSPSSEPSRSPKLFNIRVRLPLS